MAITIINGIMAVVTSGGGGGGPPSGPAGSDLGGTYPNPTVVGAHISTGTINGTTIGATTPAAGNFTSVSASSVNAAGAVSAATLAITGGLTASTGQFTSTVSANLLNSTTDINAPSGHVNASAATFTAFVTANSLHVNTTISAAGDINTLTNFVAGSRAAVVSGDTGNITGAAYSGTTGTFTGAVSALSLHINNVVSAGSVVTPTVSASNLYATTLSVVSVSGFVISKQIYVETPSNKTYPIDTIAAFPYTINTVNGIKTSAGTITAAVQINGSAVTGLGSILVNASANVTATGANTILTGDVVSLVLSTNSAADSLQFTLKATRNG